MTWKGEEMPLRSAQAKLAVLDAYADREELGAIQADASARFNPDRLELLAKGEALEAELTGEPENVARNEEEKQISLRELEGVLAKTSAAVDDAWARLRDRWFDRLLGPSATTSRRRSTRVHAPAVAARVDVPEGARGRDLHGDARPLGFDMEHDENIRLDLDDRPQKSPRACVIASDPPKVVHLITRAQGGLHDYQAFLHEAGHALHYAGCDPSLPYTFRRLSRDHALTEIYSYILESITRVPAWHAAHFGLADAEAAENANATLFLEVLLFRRYVAKLQYELDFWSRYNEVGATPDGYAERLTNAVGLRYRDDNFLSDMDAGFYSADYLRAWIRSAQLRAYLEREVGEDWWRNAGDRRPPARALLRGHAPVERGDRRPPRLRAARHRPARRRADRAA